MREPIGAKLRFEVLKRDSFTCQYCGARAPDVVLHVDHIKPVADGGGNEILNLVTSCAKCNGGKGAVPLSDTSIVQKQRAQLDELQARREQIDLMLQWKAELAAMGEGTASRVQEYIIQRSGFRGSLTEHGLAKLRKWLSKFSLQEILESTDRAVVQYSVLGDDGAITAESFEEVFNKIPRIASVQREVKERPHIKDLFYVRAIVRNRCGYFRGDVAFRLLEDAYEAGASIGALKDIARGARNWSSWQAEMYSLLDRLPKEAAT